MNDYETVTYQCENNVASISFNRPEVRNSLNQQMRFDMAAAIAAANSDVNVRVVMITGAGKGFCSGADLGEALPGSDAPGFITEQLRKEYNPIIQAILHSEKPFISVVNGAAAGIGGAIAMACDLMVMADNAFLYSAFGAISLIPDGGSHKFLQSFLGSKKAYEMIAFSQRLMADQCFDLGICNKVVAADNLISEGRSWAEELAQQAPITLKISKQLLREAATSDIEAVMDREAVLQDGPIQSKDFKEGTNAFFEKRKPLFTGE